MAWVDRAGANTWRVRYFKDNGTIGSISGFPTKTSAEHHAADIEADQRGGTFIDPARGKTTLNTWIADWLPALDVDIRTEENYRGSLRRHIQPRWGETPLADISSIRVAAWTKELSANLAPSTVAGIMKLLRMVLADAVIERLIAYNPIQPRRRGRTRTVRPTERIWATPDEVLQIADQAAACYHPGGAVLIITAAWTGARWGELTGLHRRNLHLDDGVMIVDPNVGALHEAGGGNQWLGPPKNAGSARTITLPEFLAPLLRRHLTSAPSDFVFTTPDGHWHRRSNFSRRAFRPSADGTVDTDREPDVFEPRRTSWGTEAVKLGLTFHGLRHSHKTWMIADAVPEVAQSRRLGHVLHDKIQETYSHVAAEVERGLLDNLEDRWLKAVANSTTDPSDSIYRAT
jgi:integrase